MNNTSIESIKNLISKEMTDYLNEYQEPNPGETLGIPWNLEKIMSELTKMRELLVEPYDSEYFCDDSLISVNDRLPKGVRKGYIVAEDRPYALMYDPLANDFALVTLMQNGKWGSWGIRGDACSTFMAR